MGMGKPQPLKDILKYKLSIMSVQIDLSALMSFAFFCNATYITIQTVFISTSSKRMIKELFRAAMWFYTRCKNVKNSYYNLGVSE